MPFAIHAERRLDDAALASASRPRIAAVVVALLISALLIGLIGGDPVSAYAHILRASFGSVGVLSDTLVKATPAHLHRASPARSPSACGCGTSAPRASCCWAPGAPRRSCCGLAAGGHVGASSTCPLMMVAGMAAGALWGGIAGWLKARLNVNEIITTLMLNYIAVKWVQFWVFGPWSEGGFQMSEQFPREAWLPRLTDFGEVVPDLGGLTVHLGFVLAVVAAVLVWFLLNRTRKGYEIRLIGDNPRAARYAGIDIGRNIILVMLMSGALAGLAGHDRDQRRRPPAAGQLLARLRLHRRHRRLPRPLQPVRRGRRGDRRSGRSSWPAARSSRRASRP